MVVKVSHYEYRKGWSNVNVGWYEYHVKFYDVAYVEELMEKEVIEWLYKNIDNTEQNARWAPSDIGIRVKFRFEKDALMFALRWL
jgi:hypothetical protein